MNSRIRFFLIIIGAILTTGFVLCENYKSKPGGDGLPAFAGNVPGYSRQLDTYSEFLAFQGEPLSNKFNEVLSVKVVWDIRSGNLFFLNSSKFVYHFEFCEDVLGDYGGLVLFNSLNYSESSSQKYFLANLNYYTSIKKYALEFTSSTDYRAESIDDLYREVKKHSYVGDSLYILAGTGFVNDLAVSGKIKSPCLFPDEIYKSQNFQLLQAGEVYGRLRFVNDPDSYAEASHLSDDIVVIKGTPVRVPDCAALITETFQTPLSHIQILCRSRKFPAAVIRDAFSRKDFKNLEGHYVRLVLGVSGFTIEETTEEMANDHKSENRKKEAIRLTIDTTILGLPEGKQLRMSLRNAVGNKAALAGELQYFRNRSNADWLVPEGMFAIPFVYYLEHVSSPEIQEAMKPCLGAIQGDSLKHALKVLRNKIKNQPVNEALIRLVTARILANGVGSSYRFRSSCNAEDLEGFSGAGLYSSKTGTVGSTKKSVEDAIRQVWASVWSMDAYLERRLAGIDQSTVAMGILCHRNFPEERSNGVAITKNLYRPGFTGFTVNVQMGEVSVVQPHDSVSCDQFIVMSERTINPLSSDITTDYLMYSNINSGKRVLTPAQVVLLYHALEDVKDYFFFHTSLAKGKYEYEVYGLDIEFKFDRNQRLYLKQVRMYP